MTDCFDNVVSLREYCTPETPFSGIYLNDIGLGKKQIEDILTGDYATVKAMVEATIAMTAKEVAAEVYGKFANTVQVRSVVETGVTGYTAISPTLVPTTGDMVGIKLELDNTANFMNVEIKAVSLYLDHSGNVPVLIYDIDTNTVLDTVTVTAVAGQVVSLNVSKLYRSSKKPLRLFIGYDSTAIDSYKTTTRESNCCGNYGRNTQYTHIHGWNYTTEANLQTTSGVGLTYSLVCDQLGWLCQFSQLLAVPIAYKVAAEIYRRGAMVSPTVRSNNSTNTNADLMKMNFDWHMDKYHETMSNVIKSIHIPTNSVCYSCKSPVYHKIMIP